MEVIELAKPIQKNEEDIKKEVKEEVKNEIQEDIKEEEKKEEDKKKNKESNEKNLNISDVVGEISNISKSTKKLGKDLKLNDLSKTEEDIRESLTLEESLDRVVRNFLDRNKLVLFDLDGYINMYLNLVYEQKIYTGRTFSY